MPWYNGDYPPSYSNLPVMIRDKAVEIANAILEENGDEGLAIATGVKRAKVWAEKERLEKEIAGYYSGTSGLLLPVSNKLFYPEKFRDKSRLCFYASMMNSIEINSSFYKVPTYINDWIAEGKTVYTYFNNTMGNALANLFTLKDFVIRHN